MDGEEIMARTGETVDMGLQRAQAQQTAAQQTAPSGRTAPAGPTGQREAHRYSPEQMDDLADRLLSGDRAAVREVETHPWAADEFEAFLFSLEVGIPKIAEGGPFKSGFGRQIVDSALADYLAGDDDEPFGSILMDYVDGLNE